MNITQNQRVPALLNGRPVMINKDAVAYAIGRHANGSAVLKLYTKEEVSVDAEVAEYFTSTGDLKEQRDLIKLTAAINELTMLLATLVRDYGPAAAAAGAAAAAAIAADPAAPTLTYTPTVVRAADLTYEPERVQGLRVWLLKRYERAHDAGQFLQDGAAVTECMRTFPGVLRTAVSGAHWHLTQVKNLSLSRDGTPKDTPYISQVQKEGTMCWEITKLGLQLARATRPDAKRIAMMSEIGRFSQKQQETQP